MSSKVKKSAPECLDHCCSQDVGSEAGKTIFFVMVGQEEFLYKSSKAMRHTQMSHRRGPPLDTASKHNSWRWEPNTGRGSSALDSRGQASCEQIPVNQKQLLYLMSCTIQVTSELVPENNLKSTDIITPSFNRELLRLFVYTCLINPTEYSQLYLLTESSENHYASLESLSTILIAVLCSSVLASTIFASIDG